MKEYRIADYDGKQLEIKRQVRNVSDWNKSKDNNFIDFYTKQKDFVPSPNIYKKIEEGYFLKPQAPALYKSPRITEFSALIIEAKKKPVGPGSFTPKRV